MRRWCSLWPQLYIPRCCNGAEQSGMGMPGTGPKKGVHVQRLTAGPYSPIGNPFGLSKVNEKYSPVLVPAGTDGRTARYRFSSLLMFPSSASRYLVVSSSFGRDLRTTASTYRMRLTRQSQVLVATLFFFPCITLYHPSSLRHLN